MVKSATSVHFYIFENMLLSCFTFPEKGLKLTVINRKEKDTIRAIHFEVLDMDLAIKSIYESRTYKFEQTHNAIRLYECYEIRPEFELLLRNLFGEPEGFGKPDAYIAQLTYSSEFANRSIHMNRFRNENSLKARIDSTKAELLDKLNQSANSFLLVEHLRNVLDVANNDFVITVARYVHDHAHWGLEVTACTENLKQEHKKMVQTIRSAEAYYQDRKNELKELKEQEFNNLTDAQTSPDLRARIFTHVWRWEDLDFESDF